MLVWQKYYISYRHVDCNTNLGYSGLFQVIPGYSRLFQLIPGYSRLFQIIPCFTTSRNCGKVVRIIAGFSGKFRDFGCGFREIAGKSCVKFREFAGKSCGELQEFDFYNFQTEQERRWRMYFRCFGRTKLRKRGKQTKNK